MGVITRGFKNAFRNSLRTISIIIVLGISIGLSVIMLLAYNTVGNKITSVKSSIGNAITVTPAGSQGFEGGGNPLTTAQVASISSLSHVTKVVSQIQDRLETGTTGTDTNLQSSITAGSLGQRNGNFNSRAFSGGGNFGGNGSSTSTAPTTFTPPIEVTGISDASAITGSGGSITSGTTFSNTSTSNVAVVGSDLATKNNLKVGSTFTAYSTTITVVGIYDISGNTFGNSGLYMPLTTLQTLSSQVGNVTQATVTVDNVSNTSSVVTAIQNKLGTSVADVASDQTAANSAIAPLQNIETISLYSLFGALIAGAVIILLTLMMIVRERRREIGIMKAIGSSGLTITAQFIVESLTLTIMGSIVGIALGALLSNPILHVLVTNATTSTTTSGNPGGAGGGGFGAVRSFAGNISVGRGALNNLASTVDYHVILYGLAAALAIAVIGSAIPASIISKIRPVEAMRNE